MNLHKAMVFLALFLFSSSALADVFISIGGERFRLESANDPLKRATGQRLTGFTGEVGWRSADGKWSFGMSGGYLPLSGSISGKVTPEIDLSGAATSAANSIGRFREDVRSELEQNDDIDALPISLSPVVDSALRQAQNEVANLGTFQLPSIRANAQADGSVTQVGFFVRRSFALSSISRGLWLDTEVGISYIRAHVEFDGEVSVGNEKVASISGEETIEGVLPRLGVGPSYDINNNVRAGCKVTFFSHRADRSYGCGVSMSF